MTHQGEEESLILPRIAAVCSEEELSALALTFKSVKQTAPLMPQVASMHAAGGAQGQEGKSQKTEETRAAPDAAQGASGNEP